MNKIMSAKSESAFGEKNLFVLSLGGSLIVPEKIDTVFLKKFRQLIINRIKKGDRFIIITGGGKICRNYQHALKLTSQPSADDLDWLGIYSTRFNAQLVRLMFKDYAYPKIIEDTNKKIIFKEKILLAGGWIPGRSTDDDAVRLAKVYKANTIINLSNIDCVYNKDPKKYPGAKKIRKISWHDFMKIVGDKWKPGANLPFDPVAAKLAQKFKLKVIITNGKNLLNLQNILQGKKFQGTIIY